MTGSPRQCGGFTLLELVVAMALVVAISALLFTSLDFGRAVLDRTREAVAAVESTTDVRRRLHEWINRAYPLSVGRGERFVIHPMSGSADSVVFSTSLSPAPQLNELSRVRLEFDAIERTLSVASDTDRNDVAEPAFDVHARTLLTNVERAEFSYLEIRTPPRWLSRWQDREGLPAAVRVEVAFVDGDQRRFPTLVAAPRIDVAAWCDFDPVSRDCRRQVPR